MAANNWIDTIVVILVVAAGLFILYKALREPIDLVLGWIRRGFESLKDKIGERKSDINEVIRYGR